MVPNGERGELEKTVSEKELKLRCEGSDLATDPVRWVEFPKLDRGCKVRGVYVNDYTPADEIVSSCIEKFKSGKMDPALAVGSATGAGTKIIEIPPKPDEAGRLDWAAQNSRINPSFGSGAMK